ncbi:hypothetical protein [uncultured Brevundimonas sp.]|mgnify:CR=1 FL=1|uniref:hypothetical protein n=1 Tax=uncultured Brevundimonas sp. TaxID=213418 RepID=UPI0030ED80B1
MKETTADAVVAAGMSAVVLWLTAARDPALLVVYLGTLAKLTEATAQAAPNGSGHSPVRAAFVG